VSIEGGTPDPRLPYWYVSILERAPSRVRRLRYTNYQQVITIRRSGSGVATVQAKDEMGAYVETLKLINEEEAT
jgi:hypothetical protein